MGDFTGFTYNGIHTSELDIVRVSNGSRYNEVMIPQFQDKTQQVPGSDGTYFFNSEYRQRIFNLQIAFDSMSEENYRKFRTIFSGRDIHELIFDEAPYKRYTAKVQSPPQLNTICFMDKDQYNNDIRVYKGEGTINFVCYYPFARSVHKWGNEYSSQDYPSKNEWIKASGILASQGISNSYDYPGTSIKLYNPGDLDANWKAFYAFTSSVCSLRNINLSRGSTLVSALNFKADFVKKGNDTYICIDSKTQLITGYTGTLSSVLEPSGNLYNENIGSGNFFKIPIHTDTSTNIYFNSFTSNTQVGMSCARLDYDYLYY